MQYFGKVRRPKRLDHSLSDLRALCELVESAGINLADTRSSEMSVRSEITSATIVGKCSASSKIL